MEHLTNRQNTFLKSETKLNVFSKRYLGVLSNLKSNFFDSHQLKSRALKSSKIEEIGLKFVKREWQPCVAP